MIITRHTSDERLSPAGAAPARQPVQNVGKTGRIVSLAAGSALLVKGLLQLEDRPIRSLLRLVIGGYLLQRGLSGHCAVTARLDDTVDKAENLAVNTFA